MSFVRVQFLRAKDGPAGGDHRQKQRRPHPAEGLFLLSRWCCRFRRTPRFERARGGAPRLFAVTLPFSQRRPQGAATLTETDGR